MNDQLTHGRVLAIAGPAMLAILTTPLFGSVATGAIVQLGEAAVRGGVAMASVVFDCMFWLFGFLRMSTVALTAQALGAHDPLEVRASLARGLLIAILSSVVLLVVQKPLAAIIFHLMGASAPVTEAARLYFEVRLWSAPFLLANYALLGWLIGQARTGWALAIQLAINLTNIAATVLLVIGLKQGVAGAAYAAIIAEACGLVFGLTLAKRMLDRDGLRITRAVLLDRAKLARMMAINRDIFIRTLALTGAFLIFTAQGARARDWRSCADRPDDRKPGRAAGGAHLHVARRAGADLRRNGLCVRRDLYRRDMGARHAQAEAGVSRAVFRGLGGAASARQQRAVARTADLSAGARVLSGAALSCAAESVFRGNAPTGQSSAVIIAASAPTISDSDSRPVRRSVDSKSVLIASTRPMPLYTSDEYNWISEAPARIFISAAPPESIPPTPINGKAPSARTYVSATMLVESRNNGRPDSPPCSSARPRSRSVSGRASVVFDTIMPSTPRARATCTTSSSSDKVRSGEIFNSSGTAPASVRARVRASITRARRSSSAEACCRLRRPGVFGDDTLTVK